MFINEASKLSRATQRAIRLYESLGLLSVARSGKYRVYSQENIDQIKMIREAQTLGITLSDMVALKDGSKEFDWKLVSHFLIQRQQEVESNIKELERLKLRIQQYRTSIEKCIRVLDSDL